MGTIERQNKHNGDKNMNMAQQIKAFHTEIDMCDGSNSVKDLGAFLAECEEVAANIVQTCGSMATTYEFMDDSVLVYNGQHIFTYCSAL